MEHPGVIWQKRKKKYPESYAIALARLFSFPLTYVLYHTPATPTVVSILGFLFRITGAALIAMNGFRSPGEDVVLLTVLGGIMCWFGLVLDCTDGELARLKGVSSKYGDWLDGLFDRISDVVVLAAVSLNALNHTGHFEITLIGALLATASTTLWRFFTLYTAVSFKLPLEGKSPYKALGFDKGMMYLIITVGALANQLWYVMWFFAIVINAAWIRNVVIAAFRRRQVPP